jgi:NAD kinase
MMTPICAFSMRARPIVFADTDEFDVCICKGQAIIQIDGVTLSAFPEGTTMHIKKAPFTADFPVKDSADFFARVRNKLNT